MTALPGWPAVSGAATFQHIRRSLAGQVVKSAAGVLRSGILPISTSPLVTGTATMNVAVGAFVAVADRNGAVFIPNDGSVNVLLSSAPGSGSRWSVVYTKQKESESPFSDGSSGPIIDKVESTTSESAARTLLPAGAVELAVVKVDAGSANTNAVGVTFTQTAQFTAMEGGVVLLRNSTEEGGWAPHDGSVAYRLDTARFRDRVGGVWVTRGASCHVRMSADGATNATLNTFSPVAWNVEDLDTDGFHDNATNNSRMTAPAPGLYIATGKLRYASTTNAGGVALGKNGTADYETESYATPNAFSGSYAQTVKVYQLAAGDYIEVFSKGQASSLVISADRSYGELVRIG